MSDLPSRFAGSDRDPDDAESQERAWQVVRATYDARVAAPPHRHRGGWIVVIAAALVIAPTAIAATSAGRGAIDEVRRKIGIERAQPALFSLPAPGRLLVSTNDGAWVVARDGGKRHLGAYRDASWSPRGLFVAVATATALRAIEPDGDVRWALERPGAGAPRWSPSGYRIAYLDRSGLRVVAGDGTGDARLAARAAPIAAAWKPGPRHLLAYADRSGRVQLVDTDSGERIARTPRGPAVAKLAWSGDGRLIYVQSAREIRAYRADRSWDAPWTAIRASAGEVVRDFAIRPGRHEVAVALWHERSRRTRVICDTGACQFDGAGAIAPLAWSPDAAWLLLGWGRADQLVFVRAGTSPGIRAVANAAEQFRSGAASRAARPAVVRAEWCCAAR